MAKKRKQAKKKITVGNYRVKRKPSAFNRCVGRALRAATYKNKSQWKREFKKAVKKCKA